MYERDKWPKNVRIVVISLVRRNQSFTHFSGLLGNHFDPLPQPVLMSQKKVQIIPANGLFCGLSRNWPMVLHVTRLQKLPPGGYYDLYLTRRGKPLVLCGTFNVSRGAAVVRFTAAYDLERFDKNGWVVTRQLPGHHEPTDVVLKPA